MLLTSDSLAMAEHSRDVLGILPSGAPGTVDAVREAVERDEAADEGG